MEKKTKEKSISDEDQTLFRQAVKRVSPLKKDAKILLQKKIPAKLKRPIQEEPAPYFYLSDRDDQPTVKSDDSLFFSRSGLSPKQIQRLKKGQIPIAARLDLHGFDAESAKQRLCEFIDTAYKQHRRCIILIHGKGHSEKPVLKNKLNNWLRQIDKVLGFSTAIPQHGGSGALYVLLKSSYKE